MNGEEELLSQDSSGLTVATSVVYWANVNGVDLDEVDGDDHFAEYQEWCRSVGAQIQASSPEAMEEWLDRERDSVTEEHVEYYEEEYVVPDIDNDSVPSDSVSDDEDRDEPESGGEKSSREKGEESESSEECVSEKSAPKVIEYSPSEDEQAESEDDSVSKSLFGSEQTGSPEVSEKSIYTHYVNREHQILSDAEDIETDQEEKVREAFREQVWPDDMNKSPSWQSDDDVTQQTQEWVDAVFDMRDPMYDSYDEIPQSAGLRVKEEIRDSLTQSQGWSLDSVASGIEDEFDFLERYQAERIARQEVAAVLNEAVEISLQARPEEPEVDWVGPDDGSTTELCEEVKNEVNGGVKLSKLQEILRRKAEEYDYGTPRRVDQFVPHFLCRHMIEEV